MFNFNKEPAGITLASKTRHLKQLHAFQGFLLNDSFKHCCYLQLDNNPKFRITSPNSDPAVVLTLQKDLRNAIFDKQKRSHSLKLP